MNLRDTLRELVEPTIVGMGLDLVAVEILGGQGASVVRLSVDAPGGIGADDLGRVSGRVGLVLDAADPIPAAYTLEVSSPGIERPVQRRDDFLRFTGYRCRIRLAGAAARRRYTGELRGVDGDEVLVEVDGVVHALPLADIDAAHLVLDLDAFQALAHGLPPIPEPSAVAPSVAGPPAAESAPEAPASGAAAAHTVSEDA
jgi:ribosome maturation factor RimP